MKILKISLIIIAFSLLTACIGDKPYVSKDRYMFKIPTAKKQLGQPLTQGTLQILTPNVSPIYAGQEFVVRYSDMKFVSDFYNGFFAPPAQQLVPIITDDISRANIYKTVTNAGGLLIPNFILQTNIDSLYGDFSDASDPRAVISIHFILVKQVDGKNTILINKRFTEKVQIAQPIAKDLMIGWNKGIVAIMSELVQKMKQVQVNVGSQAKLQSNTTAV